MFVTARKSKTTHRQSHKQKLNRPRNVFANSGSVTQINANCSLSPFI